MANTKVSITFRVFKGAELVRSETLSQDVIKIGKAPTSHLKIDDDAAGRMHAVVEVNGPGDVQIMDLGSSGGTQLNGKKIQKSKLEDGDVVVVGDTRLVIEILTGDADAASSSASPEGAAAKARQPAAESAKKPDAVATKADANATKKADASAKKADAPAAKKADAPAKKPDALKLPSPFAGRPSLPNPFAIAPSEPPPGAHAPTPGAAAESSSGEAHGDHAIVWRDDIPDPRWEIAVSGAPIVPAEVETQAVAAEIVIQWGAFSVIHVAHMSPPRSFYVGEPTETAPVDFLIGADALAAPRVPVVLDKGGQVAVVIPEGAECEVLEGDEVRHLSDLKEEGKLQPCPELPGASLYVLPRDARAVVEHKNLRFITRSVGAGKPIGAGPPAPNWSEQIWTLASVAFHGFFLLLFYFLPPQSASLTLDTVSVDDVLVDYALDADEDTPVEPEWMEPTESSGAASGGDPAPSGGDDTPTPSTSPTPGATSPSSGVTHDHEELVAAATHGGVLAIANSLAALTAGTPGGVFTAGAAATAAVGPFGAGLTSGGVFGDLGMHGPGHGTGPGGPGILGGPGLCAGLHCGHGPGGGEGPPGAGLHGRPGGAVPHITSEPASVMGALSQEVIRRTIRRHINEVRFCYEQQLSSRPDLEGRVAVRFIIGPTGAVTTSVVGNTTLGNAAVENCIVAAVRRWTFPPPEGGGVVGVTYPFVLQSGD